MKKYGLLIMILTGCVSVTRAQDKAPASKWVFCSFNTVGWIKGKTGSFLQLQTVNGFRKDHWFVGLGAGTDPYRVAGIPVFADARLFFGKRPSAFFVYADEGIHYPVKKEHNNFYTIRYLKGFYSDIGMGYAFACGKRSAVVLQAGYTYKRVTERQSYWIHQAGAPDRESIDMYMYDFNRLVFKLGLRF